MSLFDWFLRRQDRLGTPGDLLEMGAFMGKSAVLLGEHLRNGQKLTVCDLFGGPVPDEANAVEVNESYPSLTRAGFEQNYLAFHKELPEIIQAPSFEVPDRVPAGSCRFVHIDASHLYEHVSGDIAASRDLLGPGGVVVMDDFRSEHTPGVAAACWEAVFTAGLKPVCLSAMKMYATWEDPELVRKDLVAELTGPWKATVDVIGGAEVWRFMEQHVQTFPFRGSWYAGDPVPQPAPRPAPRPKPKPAPRSKARKAALAVLPPIATQGVRHLIKKVQI
jgi:hypothetical protein